MTGRTHVLGATGALAVLVAMTGGPGCGDEGGPPTGVVEQRIPAAQGGTLTSTDGVFTLTVPPGAIAQDTTFSVRALPRAEWPANVAELQPVGEVYDLKPDGLVFTTPAVIRWNFTPAPADTLKANSLALLGISSVGANGALEHLPSPLTYYSPEGGLDVRSEISHLSLYFAQPAVSDGMRIYAEMVADRGLGTHNVGDTWSEELRLAVFKPPVATLPGRLRVSATVDPGLFQESLVLTNSGAPTYVLVAGPDGKGYARPGQIVSDQQVDLGPGGTSMPTAPAPSVLCKMRGVGYINFWVDLSYKVGNPTYSMAAYWEKPIQCVATAPNCAQPAPNDSVGAIASKILPAGTTCPTPATDVDATPTVHTVLSVQAVAASLLNRLRALIILRLLFSQAWVDQLFNNSDFACGTGPNGLTLCPASGGSPVPPGEFVVAMQALDGPVPLSDPTWRYTYAFVFDADGNPSNNYVPGSQYPNDFYKGTDRWYEATYAPGTGWALSIKTASGSTITPVTTSKARIILLGDTVTLVVPASEFGVPKPSFRMTTFKHKGDYGINPPYEWNGDVEPPVASGLRAFP